MITVTMPIEEYQRLTSIEERHSCGDPKHDELIANVQYIDVLVNDVVKGEVTLDEAPDYVFFKSKVGEFVLANLESFKIFKRKKIVTTTPTERE